MAQAINVSEAAKLSNNKLKGSKKPKRKKGKSSGRSKKEKADRVGR